MMLLMFMNTLRGVDFFFLNCMPRGVLPVASCPLCLPDLLCFFLSIDFVVLKRPRSKGY